MESAPGCLGGFLKGSSGRRPDANDRKRPPVNRSGETRSATSVELFGMPGHGRTSFLWAMLYMLRQLSRVWPGYLCWPLDEPSGRSLLDIHEKLRSGYLPDRWSPENGTISRHALHLKNMNPWGERYFIVWDGPDPVFTPERFGENLARRPLDWNIPAFWLLSLSDLDEVRGRYLDLALDDLIRARYASGEAARQYPLRLVIVLTKADAITDLPPELRKFLTDDPLAKALAVTSNGTFRAHDEVALSPPSQGEQEAYPHKDPLNAYFESRDLIDELTRRWMSSNSAGRALVTRAAALNVELKFSVVSATGSGFASGQRLATAWRPRRVLDPYFWSLELGA